MDETELVALRIGQDREALGTGLSYVRPRGAECQQTSHLDLHVTAGGHAKVGMIPVLRGLAAGVRLQPHGKGVSRRVGWWAQVLTILVEVVAERS